MEEKEVIKQYNELVSNIETMRMYDGRDKGVDVYICKECKIKFLTRYKDKGVTPFTIKCRDCDNGTAIHKNTISEVEAEISPFLVHNWVRPTLEQTITFLNGGKVGLVEHILNGGLILEDEL